MLLDLIEADDEVPSFADGACPSARAESHEAASSSAADIAREHEDEQGFDKFIQDLGLADMSTSGKWAYGGTGDSKALFTVHKIAKGQSGYDTMKATCHLHPKCVCWVSKAVSGEQRLPLLKDLIKWGASGRALSEHGHYNAARQVKMNWGMKVK